jgi:hypothetical protein
MRRRMHVNEEEDVSQDSDEEIPMKVPIPW